jgi:parallel beta-helix repeat protein
MVLDGASYTLQGTTDQGIRLAGRTNVTVQNIKIKTFQNGIVLSGSSNNNIISGNTIANNGEGIALISSSSNRIYHNNFADNLQQVYSLSSTNTWDDDYPSGGNY